MKTISTLMLALVAVVGARADTVLYSPAKSIADQQITVHPWGSGTIAETDEFAYEGTTSIRVSTRNLFAGGQIFFGATPNLANEYSDKNDLLQITFRLADNTVTSSAGPAGGTPGKGGGPTAAGAGSGGGTNRLGGVGGGKGGPPVGNQGGPPPGAFGGGRGGPPVGNQGGPPAGAFRGGGPAAASEAPNLKTIRLVITTTDGLKSEAYVPADVAAGTNGWRQLGIPLQSIAGFERTNKIVKEISFAGDASTSVYLGDLRTIVDSTPITGDTNVHDLNLAEGDEVTLSGSGYAGASMLKYAWYFDNDTSGAPDAVGQAIKHKFNRPGTYVVTLVISDYYGLKQPYKSTINVKVN